MNNGSCDMNDAFCPYCEARVSFRGKAAVGKLLVCWACNSKLVVGCLSPLELYELSDYMADQDEIEYEGSNGKKE
jgi:hypothetical protein